MGQSFRLVPKITGNFLCIFLVYNGGHQEIARIIFPNDCQMNDNVECANAICAAMQKRIRKSV